MKFADGLYARGLYDLALDEYLLISREAETFARIDVVLYRIAECHRRLNNPDAAERFYQRVSREHPDGEYAMRAAFRRAELFVTRGRYMEGLNLFRAFLDKDPDPALAAPAWYYRGYAARRSLMQPEGENALRTVLTDYANSPFAAYAAIDLADYYRTLPDRASDVQDLYRQALTNAPTSDVVAEAIFQLAEWHFALGEYDASADRYQTLLKDHASSSRTREGALQAAWAYHNAGRYAASAAVAEAAVDDPLYKERQAEWLYVLANAQRQLFRADDARASYARLIETSPDHELSRIAAYESAVIAFRQDQFDEAIASVAGVNADAAMQQDLFWLLAESYAAVGRHDEAVQYYRRLLDEFPESDQAAKALFRLARVLQNRRDFVQAARTYRQLVERFPDDSFAAQALFAAAFCMTMEHRYDDAVKDWDQLLKAYPDDALAEETRYQRALALMQLERNRPANTAFTDFLKRHPDSPFAAEAHFWLAVLQEGEGRVAAAEKSLRAALRKEPPQALSERIRFRLALILQQDKPEEAADLYQALMVTPMVSQMPSGLLEWLTVYRLDGGSFEEAEAAAQVLIRYAGDAAWRQIGWSLSGRALQGMGRADDALAAFQKSLAEDARTREGAEAAYFIGDLELAAGNAAAARTYLERAAELASADEGLADVRARSYLGLGRAAELEEDWARAARYYMSVGVLFDDAALTPESLYRGAQALTASGRTAEAARTLSELQERYPDSEWAKRAGE